MMVIGLTGSIGMGKSTAAAMLRRLGVPVCDSDEVVHRLLGRGGAAVDAVAKAFPGVVRGGAVDRAALGAIVFRDAEALRRLEAIIHPHVRAVQRDFLKRCTARRAAVAVLDVPLLFESGTDMFCDVVIAVSAPAFVQRQRVLSRPGMSDDRLDGALARQLPDAEKRRRADFVVQTGIGRRHSLNQLAEIVRLLSRPHGTDEPAGQRPRGRRHA